MKPFFAYLLKCADGSYYCGQTDDVDARMQQHFAGAIGYTSTRKPVELAWRGEFETREGAIGFEQQIKGWSRAKKEALIRGDWAAIQALAKSHASVQAKTFNPLIAVRAEPEVRSVTDQPTLRPFDELRTGQAQGERAGADLATSENPVRAEPVEAVPEVQSVTYQPILRPFDELRTGQAQDEREAQDTVSSQIPVRAEPVEAVPEVRSVTDQQSPRPFDELKTGQARGESLQQLILSSTPATQRRAIAKAITLLESTRADHRAQGDELLTRLLPHTGKALRLGISGVPGVGKSTFIEVLGLYLIQQGHRVAVLTVDPSSTVSGGSILGDKTRMEKLSVHERAYIRPSPSSGTLGGVAEKTREAMLVCEAAGYDVVIVETVGVGQSETAVANMTDMFVLMQLPNAGDDLQAIKKGVMELADLVVINKADIDAIAAQRAQLQITSAMQLLGMFSGYVESHWHPKAMLLSALKGQGVDAFWAAVTEFKILQTANGKLAARRQQQSLAWMWERIDAGLKHAFRQNPAVSALLPTLAAQVVGGQIPASKAARNLLEAQSEQEKLAIK